jgi:hypothetical protein
MILFCDDQDSKNIYVGFSAFPKDIRKMIHVFFVSTQKKGGSDG